MLTQDISKDYLGIDYLVTIGYYVRTADSVWGTVHSIPNCWFQDTTRAAIQDGGDLRKKYGCVTIWMNEWFDDTVIPKRGDKFEITEVQTAGGSSATTTNDYIVTEVDLDTEPLQGDETARISD